MEATRGQNILVCVQFNLQLKYVRRTHAQNSCMLFRGRCTLACSQTALIKHRHNDPQFRVNQSQLFHKVFSKSSDCTNQGDLIKPSEFVRACLPLYVCWVNKHGNRRDLHVSAVSCVSRASAECVPSVLLSLLGPAEQRSPLH